MTRERFYYYRFFNANFDTILLLSCISTWSWTLSSGPHLLLLSISLSFFLFCLPFSLKLSSLLSQVYLPLFLFNRPKQGEVLFQFKLMTYTILLTGRRYACARNKTQMPIFLLFWKQLVDNYKKRQGEKKKKTRKKAKQELFIKIQRFLNFGMEFSKSWQIESKLHGRTEYWWKFTQWFIVIITTFYCWEPFNLT